MAPASKSVRLACILVILIGLKRVRTELGREHRSSDYSHSLTFAKSYINYLIILELLSTAYLLIVGWFLQTRYKVR